MDHISSYNGQLVTMQTYEMEVARGRGPGEGAATAITVGSYGKLTTAGAVTDKLIWPGGTYFVPDQVAGAAVTFVSSSAQDAPGGTGIRSVDVHYLNATLDPVTLNVPLNGLTPVTGLLTGCRFIQCMHLKTAGTGLKAAGLIEAYLAGSPTTVYSLIQAGAVRCSSSARMVPKGRQTHVLGAVGSSVSGTAAAGSQVEMVGTELFKEQYIDPFVFFPVSSIGVQDSSEAYNFPTPVFYEAGSIIAMLATTDKSAIISGDWFGIEEEA